MSNYLKVYGASDDLVEFEGAYSSEYNIYEPAEFLIRINEVGGFAEFMLTAEFGDREWLLELSAWTDSSNMTVGISFGQREAHPEDPMIFFALGEHTTVEVTKL